jgi:hypothetical protein
MTKPASPTALMAGLLVVAGICAGALVTAPARGDDTPPVGTEPTVPPTTGDGSPGGAPGGTPGSTEAGLPMAGNYDYFTAHLHPGLYSYLAQLSARHASERVWAVFWKGKYTEATGDCEYVLTRFPNHPRALHLIGEISKATNQVSLAIGYFENALALYPQYAFTHAQYGHYLTDIGVFQAGVEQLREALRLDPGQFQAKAWLAEALASHPELEKVAPANGAKGPAGNPGAGEPRGSR